VSQSEERLRASFLSDQIKTQQISGKHSEKPNPERLDVGSSWAGLGAWLRAATAFL